MKRQVWERDQGRCTYVAASGRRCPGRSRLEVNHIRPRPQGGAATVDNLRLRCRAHNQLEAERSFGAGFMREKRARARRAKAEAARREQILEVVAGLRSLRIQAEPARRIAEDTWSRGATLEEHLRAALERLCPRSVRLEPPAPA